MKLNYTRIAVGVGSLISFVGGIKWIRVIPLTNQWNDFSAYYPMYALIPTMMYMLGAVGFLGAMFLPNYTGAGELDYASNGNINIQIDSTPKLD